MKSIEMTKLVPGDIFTHEMRLNKRQAFLVTRVGQDKIECTNRNDSKRIPDIVTKKISGSVYFLRHIDV